MLHSAFVFAYLMAALVVVAGREVPLLIVPFIWFSWGPPPPPPPPPGVPTGFPEPRICPFWLDKPKITGLLVLAELITNECQCTKDNETRDTTETSPLLLQLLPSFEIVFIDNVL